MKILDDTPIAQHHLQKLLKEGLSDSVIHYRYAERIVKEATELLKKDGALNYVKLAAKEEVTIVGDLYGQFVDLKKILRICKRN